jgi:hypothetical protein
VQKIPDRIVAHPRQMLSQIAAPIVDPPIQHLVDVLLFADHAFHITVSTGF